MPLAQNPVDQGRGQLWQAVPDRLQAFRVREIVTDALNPFLPVFKALPAYMRANQERLPPVPQHARHPGKPGRVPVLFIDAEPAFPADIIQKIHALPVLRMIPGVDVDNGVQALFPGMHQARHRELQPLYNLILLINPHAVRFYQGIAEVRYILVLTSFAVQGIKPDPGPDFWVIVPEYLSDAPLVMGELLNQLPGRPVTVPPVRRILPVPFKAGGDIPHIVRGIKQRLQISD